MTYRINPLGWLLSKRQKISVGENVEKLEPSCIAHGNVKWYSHGRTWCVGSSKYKTELPYNPAVPLLSMYLKELKAGTQTIRGSSFLITCTQLHPLSPWTRRQVCPPEMQVHGLKISLEMQVYLCPWLRTHLHPTCLQMSSPSKDTASPIQYFGLWCTPESNHKDTQTTK